MKIMTDIFIRMRHDTELLNIDAQRGEDARPRAITIHISNDLRGGGTAFAFTRIRLAINAGMPLRFR